MRTKTKVIRVIENIHMPSIIKSIPNWISNSNSKVNSNSDSNVNANSSSSSLASSSSSASASTSACSSSSSGQKLKSKLKFKSLSKPKKITTIENLNTTSDFSDSSEITSKYSKEFISKAFINTFSNQFSTEKRTIVLDELFHHCSPEELNLLKKLIDKNLTGLTQSDNTNIKKTVLINDTNDYKKPESSTFHFVALKNNSNTNSNTNNNNNINSNNTNTNTNNTNYNYNINERGYSYTSIPYYFTVQNSNETLINESTGATSHFNLMPSFYPIYTNYNNFYNYNHNTCDPHSNGNTKSTNNTLSINSHKEVHSLFDKLADELLMVIFSYLDTQSLAYASQVNSRWYSLLRGNTYTNIYPHTIIYIL